MARRLIPLVLILALVTGLVPTASFAALSARTSWNPDRITALTLVPETGQVTRGSTYEVPVTVTVAGEIFSPEIAIATSGGLDVTHDADVLLDLADGDSVTFNLFITIPEETSSRSPRNFSGRVRLIGEDSVGGGLSISIRLPTPRIKWERGRRQIHVPAGQTLDTTLALSSTIDIDEFSLRSSRPNFLSVDVDGALVGRQPVEAKISVTAPATSRRRYSTIAVVPFDGRRAVPSPLLLRVVIEPVLFTWDPPQLEINIPYGEQAIPQTVRVAASHDIDGITFRTRDVGLVSIVSPEPEESIDLVGGEFIDLEFEANGVYAPSRYFVSVMPYRSTTQLGNPLRINVNIVETRD